MHSSRSEQKVLRVEQDSKITYLLLPAASMWCDAQSALSALEGVGNWDIDFCLAVDDECGMISQDRSATIHNWRCYLVKRVDGQWIPPSECKLTWNESGRREISTDLQNYVEGFRPVHSLLRTADGHYVPTN